MGKRIVSVGVSIAGDVEYASLQTPISLLDWDIVIFRPDISEFTAFCSDTYMGKKSLDDDTSVRIIEAAKHIRNQLEIALSEGKTIFAFLKAPESLYVATGERRYSGTGRSQTSTRVVEEFSSYRFLMVPGGWVMAQGTEINLDSRSVDLFGAYWSAFSKQSTYNVLWEKNAATAILHTKSGNRPVGHMISYPTSGGTLFLLPDIDFDDEDHYVYDGKTGKTTWSKGGLQFGSKLVAELVRIASTASASQSRSVEPPWAASEVYELPCERELKQEILRVDKEIGDLQADLDAKIAKLREEVSLRDLVFETGRPLEFAILRALRILGFQAENFNDGNSEFDAVFSCPEGRLIGEAEGKDSKQINITKLRQLSTNVIEDFDREEVSTPAKGVLFGNAFRLTPPDDRPVFFTDKCIVTASSTSIALVSTVDLFLAAKQQLLDPSDEFCSKIRMRILKSSGIVELLA